MGGLEVMVMGGVDGYKRRGFYVGKGGGGKQARLSFFSLLYGTPAPSSESQLQIPLGLCALKFGEFRSTNALEAKS